MIEPRSYSSDGSEAGSSDDPHHVLLVLDVSPSMRLLDAGPEKKESRMQRARELMDSFFARVPVELYRVSVVAVYNGAKPVVVDTKDYEVVRNILGDLPMHYAFPAGKTKLLSGLEEAVKLAEPWNPRSTTLVVLSDGDTVPGTGMPRLPASIRSVLVVGVGDPNVGKFIDGRQSRQDVPTLKQIAVRLGGTFHNGNDHHLASALISDAMGLESESLFEKLTLRDYALLACAAGALVLGFLPLLLHFFGTSWRPGASPVGAPAPLSGLRGPRAVTAGQQAG
jgi:Ca-activated chloride channel family protein